MIHNTQCRRSGGKARQIRTTAMRRYKTTAAIGRSAPVTAPTTITITNADPISATTRRMVRAKLYLPSR